MMVYQHFVLFPQCFKKAVFLKIVKNRNCMVKDFNPFQNQPLIYVPAIAYNSFENTVEKGKIAHNEQFLLFFFNKRFLPFWRTFLPFSLNLNSRLQTLSVWESLKFVVWEKVRIHLSLSSGNGIAEDYIKSNPID